MPPSKEQLEAFIKDQMKDRESILKQKKYNSFVSWKEAIIFDAMLLHHQLGYHKKETRDATRN